MTKAASLPIGMTGSLDAATLAALYAQMPAVRFYKPTGALAELLTSFYVVETTLPLVDHLHPEWGNIRVVASGSWTTRRIGAPVDPHRSAGVYGPTDRTRRVEASAGKLFGIGLTPLGWLRLIKLPAGNFANRVTALEDTLGAAGTALIAALDEHRDDEPAAIASLAAILEACLDEPQDEEQLVRGIHLALIANDFVSVAALAELFGISERTLHRACLRAFGFSTKRLLRRQRFLRALDAVISAEGQPISQILGDEYYDQSHFNREFQSYIGMTPGAYFRSPRMVLRPAAIERERIIGAKFQALHPPATRD